jgi:cysteine desulfurase
MSIYLDNQATTRIAPEVIAAMLPMMETHYANPGSTTHHAGRLVSELVHAAIERIGAYFNAGSEEIVVTSGATESNNLALFGVALHPKQKRRSIVTLATEHRALLDPLVRLQKMGFEVIRLPVLQNGHDQAGMVELDRLASAIGSDTALVSVMMANNEIGIIQPVREIAKLCAAYEVPLHTDASQAVGRLPIDVQSLGVDLMSFSAHKFYGPKGIGGLYVRQTPSPIRLYPQILGGGQQSNLRSGTLNSVGIVGMAKAIELLDSNSAWELDSQERMRNMLWRLLNDRIDGLTLNGPIWKPGERVARLVNNLNVCFPKVEGQSLMLEVPELSVSSGSACTSAEPHPSHVLLEIGLSIDQARSSLRFGMGRFNTEEEIQQSADWLCSAHSKLASFAA